MLSSDIIIRHEGNGNLRNIFMENIQENTQGFGVYAQDPTTQYVIHST